MKYFDLEIYELENKIKTLILIIIVFIFGFLLGHWTKNNTYEEQIHRQQIEIVDLKEQKYRLEMREV